MSIGIEKQKWDLYNDAYLELKDKPEIANDPEFTAFTAIVQLHQSSSVKPSVTPKAHRVLERFLNLSTFRHANQMPDQALARVIKEAEIPTAQAKEVIPPAKPAAQRLQEIEDLLPVLFKKADLRIVGDVLNVLGDSLASDDPKRVELRKHQDTLGRIQAQLGDAKEIEFPQTEQKTFATLILFSEQNFPANSDFRRPFTELLRRWKVNQGQRILGNKDAKTVGTEEYLGRPTAAWRSLEFRINAEVAEQLNQALKTILALPLGHHPDAMPDESLRFQRYFLAVEIARGAKPPHAQYIGDFAETVKVILDRLPQDHPLFAPLKELFISWQAIDNRKPGDGGKKTKLEAVKEDNPDKKRVRGLAVVESSQFMGQVENWRYPPTAVLSREISRLLTVLVSIHERIVHGSLPASPEDRRFILRAINSLRDWQRAEDPRSDGVLNHPMSEAEKKQARQAAQNNLGKILFVVQAYAGTEFFKTGSIKSKAATDKSSDEEGKKVKKRSHKASKEVATESEDEDPKDDRERKEMTVVSSEQRQQTRDVMDAWGLPPAVKASELPKKVLRDESIESDSLDDWDWKNDRASDHPLTSYPQPRGNGHHEKANPGILTTSPRRIFSLEEPLPLGPQSQAGSALSLVETSETALKIERPEDRPIMPSISKAELIKAAKKAPSSRAEAEHFLTSYALFIRQTELGSRVTVKLLTEQMEKSPAMFAKAFNSDVGALGEAILTQDQVETMHEHLKPHAGETHIHADKPKETKGGR